jgi:hypothetical protein
MVCQAQNSPCTRHQTLHEMHLKKQVKQFCVHKNASLLKKGLILLGTQ